MKIAIFTNMMPAMVQDYVYIHVEKDTPYDTLKEKIKVLVSNKVAMNMGPAPMDIGRVADELEENIDYEENAIDAVYAYVQCHRCGGWGHLARECATKGKGKGDGKGGKGGGKAAFKGYGGKGESKGGVKGTSGPGKGYQGTCWRCGKVGHKQAECRVQQANSIDEENEAADHVDVGGVWMIGAVTATGVGMEGSIDHETKILNANVPRIRAADAENVEDVCAVDEADKLTRESGMIFNVADVSKPLASAVKVCEAGNLVVLHPDPDKSYIENLNTRERIKIRKDKGTFVFDVEYADGTDGTITLDSGAGVTVWPKNKMLGVKMMPKRRGLRMVAANGTDIENFGQKVIKLRGVTVDTDYDQKDESLFQRRA